MKRSTFLTAVGSETTVIGFCFAFQQAMIRDDPHSPIVHILHALGSPYWTVILIMIGLFAAIVGLLGPGNHWPSRIALSLLSGVWAAYSVAFLAQDMDFGHLELITIFSLYVFILTVLQAGGGGHE